MAIQRYGNALATCVEQPDSPKISYAPDGTYSVTRHWKGTMTACRAAAASFAMPKAGADSLFTTAYCISCDINRIVGEEFCDLTAVYQGLIGTGTVIYELVPARRDMPIIHHPDFNNATKFGYPVLDVNGTVGASTSPVTKIFTKNVTPAKFEGFHAGAKTPSTNEPLMGIETYLTATFTWKKTSFHQGTPPPVTGLDHLYKIDTPDSGSFSLPSGTGNRSYMKVDHSFRNMVRGASNIWQIDEAWWYVPEGWVEAVYGT